MNRQIQQKQKEWIDQWSMFQDNELFLFEEWISPLTLENFCGKEVMEAGCGGGQHTLFMAPYAKSITAVDLNTVEIAKERTKNYQNIEFVEADIATMELKKQFDIVLSIGVVHHTDDPDKTVANLIKHVKPGGMLVLWVYSKEGNFFVEYGVEPIRRLFLRKLPRKWLYSLSVLLTTLMILPIYSLYKLPLPFLPFYEHFKSFRRLSFFRNVLNVFDKLNAPQVQFITKKRILSWFTFHKFNRLHLESYCGVSWRVSGYRDKLNRDVLLDKAQKDSQDAI